MRAVSGIYGGVPKAAKNSPRVLQNDKSPSFQGKRRGSDEKYEVNTKMVKGKEKFALKCFFIVTGAKIELFPIAVNTY